MGVKRFFKWLKSTFPNCTGKVFEKPIDNLFIDMNSLYHSSCQKVYMYGDYAPLPRLLTTKKPSQPDPSKMEIKFIDEICNEIDREISLVQPRKRVVLCVDGVAPLGKQNQQRLRRFKSSIDYPDRNFDTNAISPGTLLMSKISYAIEVFIIKNISKKYSNIEFIFSSEQAPGEGEHKIISYIRKMDTNETCCIIALDADLIMLSLATHHNNIYLLRLNPLYNDVIVNIDIFRKELLEKLKSNDEEKQRNNKLIINDFVMICFLIGNDFLPNIPTMDIMYDAVDIAIDEYMKIKGHLTLEEGDKILLNHDNLYRYITTLASYETKMINDKIQNKDTYFSDPLLEKNITDDNKIKLESYKCDYYNKHFKNFDSANVCNDYINGMQWILTYYTTGIHDWDYTYSFHYSPFFSDLAPHFKTFKSKLNYNTKPNEPFKQLLGILPPKSSHLLPQPLGKILETDLSNYCPETFEIDYSGKREKWEAIILIPYMNKNEITKIYNKYKGKITNRDLERNVFKPSLKYVYDKSNEYYIRLKNVTIRCHVLIDHIEL